MKRTALYILLLFPLLLCAQTYTINGYVSDASSAERLIGAAVFDTISQHGAVTNTAGFYTLTLPAGKHAIQVCYVGYHPSKPIVLDLRGDTLISFNLHSSTRLEEVTVIAHPSLSGPQSAQMSAIEVPISQIKGIPAIGGEVDILKAIQLLPGVQSGSEGTTGIYVRGGGPDENLITLDGVPLYNVSHLMGFFSVFNADAVKNVTLYKGNFPARYGSRLSSVIDVRQNDGNATGYHGNLSVGLLSAKLNLEGPIYWNKNDWRRFASGDTVRAQTTFNISARRTYFDLFTAPLMALIAKVAADVNGTGGYYFYDVNAKLSHTFSENDRLSGSFYMGDDVMYLRYGFDWSYMNEINKGDLNVRMGWGNLIAAANWEHRYSSRMFSNTQVAFTRYRYHLGENMHEEYQYWDASDTKQTGGFDQSMGYNSNIYDVSANTHFEFTPNSRHTLNFGAEFIYHQFQPSVSNFFVAELGQGMRFQLDTTIIGGELMRGYEATLYVEDSYTPWSWLKLNYGLRGSLYHTGGKTYPSLEPRVGARALITKDFAFKASYSYTSQYVHMLSNSSISLPTDLWVPVTKNIPPMHAMIVAAGLSYDLFGQLEISVEGYYKRMKNLIEYKDGATFFGTSTGWEDKVAVGDGWSYGVELLLQRKVGPVTGWIGYTWSRTMRQFNREGQELNFGKPFHAKYEREHDLSVTLQYEVNKKVDLSATFVYGTGQRATLGTQAYHDPTVEEADNTTYPIQHRVIGERNNYIMPDYHRLDLGANFHIPHHKSGDPSLSKGGWLTHAEHQVYVGVYNVYCRMNPYLLYESGGKLYQISLFPLLPSISYSFKF